jgi:signal transduction histidine kinase
LAARFEIETDDGCGSAGAPAGFGLLGARERVQLLGGTMRVHTAIGQGFTLTVELPV